MEKKKREEPANLPNQKTEPRKCKRIRSKRAGVVLCAFAALFILLLCYRQLHTFSALYMKADKAFSQDDYDAALQYTEEALEKKPSNLSANLLLARILKAQGDADSAVMVMRPMINTYSDSVPAYQLMVSLLSDSGRAEEIGDLLDACKNQKVLEACGDYVCQEPVSSLPPGTYTSMRMVELSAEYEQIYYTTDGSLPTQTSTLYTGPIPLPEGTTELNAFGVNGKNISSDVITRKYVIVLKNPDPPVIAPEAGSYTKDTKIELEVPDGCRAYYAFDKVPTIQSTEYLRPISMPQGSHVFYAVLVAANSKISEVSSKEYYLEY